MKGRLASLVLTACLCAPAAPGNAQPGPPYLPPDYARSKDAPPVILAHVMQAALFQIDASKLALARTRNTAVERLAQRLLERGRVMQTRFAALAPDAPQLRASLRESVLHTQWLDQLLNLREPYFDARYLASMRGLYQQLIQDLRYAADEDIDGPTAALSRRLLSQARRTLDEIRSAQDML